MKQIFSSLLILVISGLGSLQAQTLTLELDAQLGKYHSGYTSQQREDDIFRVDFPTSSSSSAANAISYPLSYKNTKKASSGSGRIQYQQQIGRQLELFGAVSRSAMGRKFQYDLYEQNSTFKSFGSRDLVTNLWAANRADVGFIFELNRYIFVSPYFSKLMLEVRSSSTLATLGTPVEPTSSVNAYTYRLENKNLHGSAKGDGAGLGLKVQVWRDLFIIADGYSSMGTARGHVDEEEFTLNSVTVQSASSTSMVNTINILTRKPTIVASYTLNSLGIQRDFDNLSLIAGLRQESIVNRYRNYTPSGLTISQTQGSASTIPATFRYDFLVTQDLLSDLVTYSRSFKTTNTAAFVGLKYKVSFK